MCSKGMELHISLINAERSFHLVTCSKVVRFLALNLQNMGMLVKTVISALEKKEEVHATISIYAQLIERTASRSQQNNKPLKLSQPKIPTILTLGRL